jgi:uracil-DNA glycosylase family 4
MFVRTASKCKDCPLRDRKRVWGQGKLTGIALIGEAPGQEEDFEGKPFVGRAGKVLTWGVESAHIPRESLWLTNALACRPPGNKIDSSEAQQALMCCKPGFDEELEYLQRSNIRVLVPLGATALRALDLDGSITKVRGSVYQVGSFVVVPTFHPSYIMRAQFKKETSEVTYKYVWIADLHKAHELLEKGWQAPQERFVLQPIVEDVLAWCDEAISKKALIGVDIETDSSHVFVIGLASSGEDALSVPIYQHGGSPYWVNGDWQRVKHKLDELFQQCPLMFQNALFDVPYLKGESFAIDFDRVQEDTLVLHHAISPELPHNLAFIVSIYGETPYWKADLLDRRGSIAEMPDEVLRRYNLRDAVVLHQVLPGMLADLREMEAEDVYREESLRLLAPVGEMIATGFKLDSKKLESITLGWKHEQAHLEATLKHGLPSGFNLDSDDDLRWFLFGIKPAKFQKLDKLKEYNDASKTGKRTLRAGTKIHKELLALQEIALNIQPVYLLEGWTGRKTKTGSRAVDKQGLLAFQIQLQNRLKLVKEFKHEKFKTEQSKIESLLAWLASYKEYSELSKLLSTYTSYPVGHDGRVHTQFLVHGTTTGRLSSRSPNLQNLPKKHEEAREPFVASEGNVLLSADYSNLEVRVLAYETNDNALVQALAVGTNIHDENTRVLFGITPQDPRWEVARRAAKVFMFGGISYGGSDAEIHEKISLECPEMLLTRAEYIAAKHRWMSAHPAYGIWAASIRKQVHVTRTSRTFLGRVRTLHGEPRDIEKEALNTPIQGGAAHIINRAMIAIHARKRILKSKLLVQIHDQLIYDVPKAELEIMMLVVREEMEAPMKYYNKLASFPVDLATGSSWGDLHATEA